MDFRAYLVQPVQGLFPRRPQRTFAKRASPLVDAADLQIQLLLDGATEGRHATNADVDAQQATNELNFSGGLEMAEVRHVERFPTKRQFKGTASSSRKSIAAPSGETMSIPQDVTVATQKFPSVSILKPSGICSGVKVWMTVFPPSSRRRIILRVYN